MRGVIVLKAIGLLHSSYQNEHQQRIPIEPCQGSITELHLD